MAAAKKQTHKPPPGLQVFLEALRWQESGSPAGNYKEGNGQGAYQIIQSNWPTWAAQYAGYHTTDANASDAPKAVQDKVAAGKVTDYFYGAGEKNWRLVARIWNGGSPNAVPNPALGAGATTDTYATEVLSKANQIKSGAVKSTPVDTTAATGNPAGTGGKSGCQHALAFGKLGSICLDKPLAIGAMTGGVTLILVGAAILVVAAVKESGVKTTAAKGLAVLPGTAGKVGKIAATASAAKANRSDRKVADQISPAAERGDRRDPVNNRKIINKETRRNPVKTRRQIRPVTLSRPGIETNPRPRPHRYAGTGRRPSRVAAGTAF